MVGGILSQLGAVSSKLPKERQRPNPCTPAGPGGWVLASRRPAPRDKRCPNQVRPRWSGGGAKLQPSADVWAPGSRGRCPRRRPQATGSPRAEGSGVEARVPAFPGPASVPCALPEASGPSRIGWAGEWSPGPALPGGCGQALGSVKCAFTWMCPVSARGTPSFKGQVRVWWSTINRVTPSSSPAGPGPAAGSEATPPRCACGERRRLRPRAACGSRGRGRRGAGPSASGGPGRPSAALGNPERALCSLSSQCPSYIVFCS